MSGLVKYIVLGSISVLIAANAAFNAGGVLGLGGVTLVFVGGLGTGCAVTGLYQKVRRQRRRSAGIR